MSSIQAFTSAVNTCTLHRAVNDGRVLLPDHRDELRRSGLSDQTILAAGIHSVTDADELAEVLGWDRPAHRIVPAMVFPYPQRNDETPYARVKPDKPRTYKEKIVKYESPRGQRNRAYFPPGVDRVLDDSNVPIGLTEGEKKAIAGAQYGFPVIGLVGVWGWKAAKTKDRLLPELEDINFRGRDVFIIFDSDAATKPDVRRAEQQLFIQLKRRGADVKIVRLPPGDPDRRGHNAKVGLDDFLVAHGPDALRALVTQATAPTEPCAAALLLSADDIDPRDEAHRFLELHKSDGQAHLIYWRGVWWRWRNGKYEEQLPDDVEADLVRHLYRHLRMIKTNHVSNIMAHLRVQASVSSSLELPSWLGQPLRPWEPQSIIACRNSLVHLPSLVNDESEFSCPASPRYFSPAALDYDFSIDAPAPANWLRFLDQLWPEDPESICTLQQLFGYFLTPDTSQQKIFGIVGPKRAGKGTIGRVLIELIGRPNVAGPTLDGLTTDFGLWPLLGKTVAIVSDARLNGRKSGGPLIERLLAISGEDTITINRKHLSLVTTKLLTRFLFLTNELPAFNDASGALASRFVLLRLSESFLGREDTALTRRLLIELPGILLWAIEGWRQLQLNGCFHEPRSVREMRDDLERLTSPVSAFLRDCCSLGPTFLCPAQQLYEAYKSWCMTNGRHPQISAHFGRDLRAAVPALRVTQPHSSDGRPRVYGGVGLRDGVSPGTARVPAR